MKKNIKGFVFIETLVTIVILTMALLSLYVLFSNMIINEKRRLQYDDPIYLFRASNISSALQSIFERTTVHEDTDDDPFGFEDLLKVYDSNGVQSEINIRELNCSNDVFNNNITSPEECSNFLSVNNVYKIYVSKYDLSYVDACKNNPNDSSCVVYNHLSKQAKNYLNYLVYSPGASGYLLIYEFADNGDGISCGSECQHTFASIKYNVN